MINDNIPSEFELAGIKFKVIEKESIKDNDTELYGEFDTNQNTITLAKTVYGEEVTPQTKINTFYHELAHILQYYYNNELKHLLKFHPYVNLQILMSQHIWGYYSD